MSQTQQLSAQATLEAVGRGALLIDVRPQASRERDGAVAGARIISKSDIVDALSPSSRSRLPRTPGQAVILFCTTENGSQPYIKVLQQLGVPDLYHVDGGFQALRLCPEVVVLPLGQGQGTSIRPANEA